MNYNIAYYVHHHGSGHLMRAIAIASSLDRPVTFLGSGLRSYLNMIPRQVDCIHLPMDTADQDEDQHTKGNEVDIFHYAPLNVKGIRERNRIMADFFSAAYPLVLIVDVSVEIVLLARLCSIPTIVIRQHGHRNDVAHLAAYQSAALLIAPYAKKMQKGSQPWVDDKTFFSGGFSRYSGQSIPAPSSPKYDVAVICGKGGTSVTIDSLIHLARVCPFYHFYSIGDVVSQNDDLPSNLTLCGYREEPFDLLNNVAVVIGNAGHNTVMEVADLKRPFICIPEERPFDEQIHKAEVINSAYGVPVVFPEDFYKTDWNGLINKVVSMTNNWRGMINKKALNEIALAINNVAKAYLSAADSLF